MSVQFRLIKPEEIPLAAKLYGEHHPWAALPSWLSTFVKVKDGNICGLYDIQLKATVGNLINFDNSPVTVAELVAHVDAKMDNMNVSQYEFIVPNQNEKFQKFLTKHYGLEGIEEVPHKLFIVRK